MFAHREAPVFMIVDRNGAIVSWSEGATEAERAECAAALELRTERAGALSPDPPFELLSRGKALRFVRLAGDQSEFFAAFLEDGNGRMPVVQAAQRFGLTERESDVLELLSDGTATAAIAAALSIRPGTVRDHVESLFRKTDTNGRVELLARVMQPKDPVAPEHGRDGKSPPKPSGR